MRTNNQGAVIELAPMPTAQFEKWKPGNIADYARQHTIGGKWTAKDSLRLAREEFDQLLPQGIATPGHTFFSITRSSDRKAVGILWIKVEREPMPVSFIYLIEIFQPFRRRGFATQAMKLLEKEMRRSGLESIRLHVFGHNPAARSLYEKLGYVTTNVLMRKRLPRPHQPSATTRPST